MGAARATVVAALVASGCASHSSTPPPETALVVGVQSDDMGGLVGMLHVVTKVDGVVASDDTILPPGGDRVSFPGPWEKKLTPAAADGTGRVDVEADAFTGGDTTTPEVITRLASTQFVPGKTLLLRVHLEARCVVPPSVQGVPDAGPGPLAAPTCTGSQTCIDGRCQDDAVPAGQLEPYAPNWPRNTPDICKPLNAGPPDVQAGTGQTDYAPLVDGQILQAERGPQGGHHVWIALRQKNLKQSGTTTTISAVQPDTGVAIPSSAFVFTFDPDEGGYCKLYGLRYQLDNGGIDYTQFLGKRLDVTIKVADAAGAVGVATAHIAIAPTLLNP